MDSLIFELQIAFYFQLFLSANVRHTQQGKHAQNPKGDVRRDDSQRRFLAQHSLTTLLLHGFEWLQYCSNI